MADGLLEVAVALPMRGTFTYRDPRGGAPVPLGSQVVVPFGRRTVTGFVVGHPSEAPETLRDIEAVVGDTPVLDPELVALCRWAAGYYLAPLGEVIRAALPQGEKVTSVRAVRLTERGREELASALLAPEPLLAALAEAGGEIGLRAWLRQGPRAARQIRKLEAAGFIEVGDAVGGRRAEKTITMATAVPGARARVGKRPAQFRVLDRIAASHEGLDVTELCDAERAHLRALAAAGLVELHRRPRPSEPGAGPASGPLPTPTAGQAVALAALGEALGKGFATFVLRGVTGSGKTEIYLRVIAAARASGQGALVLVPEIALTPQLAARFAARFGDDVAVLHSGLGPGARLAAWRRLKAGEVGIAVGARSAIFAPVRSLGVVVVDEEHDGSFKQEDGVRYNARDLAVVRARAAGALCILGSATPSLESMHNVTSGRFRRLDLPERATPRPLPPVEIVDLRRTPPGPDGLFSAPLAEAVAATLAAGEQSILFLNRRGFSTIVLCRACGEVIRCGHCAVSMTYHRARDRLVCHYCAEVDAVPSRCRRCGVPALDRLGFGTERVEAIVRERFPGAVVARLDRDTATGRAGGERGLTEILDRMRRGEIDILVGTQMVTKGHDFGGVTLVGVLNPDQGMHLPDFRASERTFQILEQVSGRAGRGDRPGRVVVQTFSPDHPAITCVRSHDYEGFVKGELEHRREAGYPPWSRMAVVRIDGPDAKDVEKTAKAAAELARTATGRGVRILGPAEAPIARVRGRARFQVWLLSTDRHALAGAAAAAGGAPTARDVRLAVDVDPQTTL